MWYTDSWKARHLAMVTYVWTLVFKKSFWRFRGKYLNSMLHTNLWFNWKGLLILISQKAVWAREGYHRMEHHASWEKASGNLPQFGIPCLTLPTWGQWQAWFQACSLYCCSHHMRFRHSFIRCLLSTCYVLGSILDLEMQRYMRWCPCLHRCERVFNMKQT